MNLFRKRKEGRGEWAEWADGLEDSGLHWCWDKFGVQIGSDGGSGGEFVVRVCATEASLGRIGEGEEEIDQRDRLEVWAVQ